MAEEADAEEEQEEQGAEGEISKRAAIAGTNSKLQSQLTTVDRYVVNADVMTNVYTDESSEAQALQDLEPHRRSAARKNEVAKFVTSQTGRSALCL